MNKGDIYKLDSTIRKRLGIKANRIWYGAKKELEVLEIIKNHLNRKMLCEPETNILEKPNKNNFTIYYDYYRRKADEETMEQIILWLKENISKERLKELIKDE